jgi:gliding motility-associated-like protein
MRFAYCLFLLLTCLHVKAQREVNVWHFGFGAGIDFNADPPEVVTDGKLNTWEGCASICDEYGKLLMYTDGDTVFNGKHQIMVNGTGLHGFFSSAQSAMIIKQPKNDSLYLIFNPGDISGSVKGFYYSVVNVYAKGGRGEVTVKNVKLKDNMTTESVSAVKHANGLDVWVVFKNDNSNEFVSYLVTALGVSNVMTFSQPGPTLGIGYPNGYTLCSKFSPSGKKYAICIWAVGVCLYDFDNKTGYLSNRKIIPLLNCYGVEFSPNEKFLYASSFTSATANSNGLYQYDISSNNITAINASSHQLLQKGSIGAIQLAPDRKIYFVQNSSSFISVINSPDLPKAACDVQENSVSLKGKRSGIGLPPFISTYFSDSIESKISFKGKCAGESFKFECLNLKDQDSVVWDFGDPASGAKNSAFVKKPDHVYTKADSFTVKAYIFRKNINNHYVMQKLLKVSFKVFDYLGKANEYPLTLNKCIGDSVLLKPNSGGSGLSQVLWGDLQGDVRWRHVHQPGLFVATIYKIGSNCFYKDTIVVTDMNFVQKPDLGPDTLYCVEYGQLLNETIGTQLSNLYTYTWNTGQTTKNIQVSAPGRYMVTASRDGECPRLDTVDVSMSQKPSFIRLTDTAFCNDKQTKKIKLIVNGDGNVSWSTGESGEWVTMSQAGNYHYSVSNACGVLKDSFNMQLIDAPVVDLGKDLTICAANGFEIKSNMQGKTYRWMPGGEVEPSLFIYGTGKVSLEVTNEVGCKGSDEIFILDSCEEQCYVPNAFTPNEDGLNDVFKPRGNDLRSKGYFFRVYDRWGGIIYETDKVEEGWNGMFKNRVCPIGVYFYTVEFVTSEKKTIHMKGTFTLMH